MESLTKAFGYGKDLATGAFDTFVFMIKLIITLILIIIFLLIILFNTPSHFVYGKAHFNQASTIDKIRYNARLVISDASHKINKKIQQSIT